VNHTHFSHPFAPPSLPTLPHSFGYLSLPFSHSLLACEIEQMKLKRKRKRKRKKKRRKKRKRKKWKRK
jgi:hypothetical protein